MEADPNARALEGQRASAPDDEDDATPGVSGDAVAQPDMQPAEPPPPLLQDRRRPRA